jgi:hypothetical protein
LWLHKIQEVEENAEFEVLTPVVMKSTIFWDITPCSPLKVNRRFGGIHRLHQGFHAGFLLGLFSEPEEGGDMFLRNFSWLSTDCSALYPRGQNSRAEQEVSYCFMRMMKVPKH